MTPRKHTCNSDSEILKVKGWAKNTRQIQFTLKNKKKRKPAKITRTILQKRKGWELIFLDAITPVQLQLFKLYYIGT